MNCELKDVATAIQDDRIKKTCINKNDLLSYLKDFSLDYLNKNQSHIIDVIEDYYNESISAKVNLKKILGDTNIKSYVETVISELGEYSFNSEEFQKDQSKSIEKLLHGEEKYQFINHAKKLISESLYIRSGINDRGNSTKYFVNSEKDISDSLKMLQKKLIFDLTNKYTVTNTQRTQKEILVDLFKNKNDYQGKNKLTYLLLLNFDNFVSELTDGLVSVENESDIYQDDLKYKYTDKLDIVKNYGDSDTKVQANPGINNYITSLSTTEGIHLNTTGFQIAFHEIMKTLPSKATPYTNINNFEALLPSHIKALKLSAKTLTEQMNIETVFNSIFNKDNNDSLLNIHKRTQEKYPAMVSDLYTMLCNSMIHLNPAKYTAVIYNDEDKVFRVSELKQKTVDQHRITIEENIVSSLNNVSINTYLGQYFSEDHFQNGKLRLETKDGVINGGKISVTFKGKTPNIFLEGVKNVNLTTDNNAAIEFIKNNIGFIKDSILIDLSEYESAFNSIAKNGGAANIMQFVGATILSRAFNVEHKNDTFGELKIAAKSEFPDKNVNFAFSQISNVYKPGILALKGLEQLADMYAIIFGDGNTSNITNPEGNKLPVFKNFSLISDPSLWFNMLQQETTQDGYMSTFKDNIFNTVVGENDTAIKWESAAMTSVVTVNPETKEVIHKPVTSLNRSELFYNSFIYNYLLSEGRIGFQPVVYSDKSTINNLWTNRKSLIDKIENSYNLLSNKVENASLNEKITQVYYDRNKKIATSLANNILIDINKVLGKTSLTGNLYDDILQGYGSLSEAYKSTENESGISRLNTQVATLLKEDPNFEFIEEIHYSLDKKGNVVINPTLLHFFQMFLTGNQTSFLEKINIQKALAIHDLNADGFVFRAKDNFGNTIVEAPNWDKKNWYNNSLEEYTLFKIKDPKNFTLANILKNKSNVSFEIQPDLDNFLLLDMFVSDQFNLATIGNAFIHNAKVENTTTSNSLLDEFKEGSVPFHKINSYESTQTIGMYKRAVGFTANMFTFARGLNTGIPDKLNFAILDDPKEMVLNAQNTSDAVDIHDGSMFFNSLVNDMMQSSLGELTVNKKHFKPFIMLAHSKYCATSEIKTAGFTINNYTMREGVNSSENYNTIFKKMTNIRFPDEFTLNIDSKNIEGTSYLTTVKDSNEKLLATITEITSTDGRTFNVKRKLKKDDDNITDYTEDNLTIKIDSVYDLWLMFGGAYSYKNKIFTEESLEKVSSLFATNPDIRNFMTHFLVKASSCKTGITNRNGRDSLKNSDVPFNTFSSPAIYFGMQLDASHGVDGGDVTGSVQQISSLIQGGYTEEETNDVYQAIGKLITENLEGLNLTKIDTPEKEKELLITLSKFVINNIDSRTTEVGLTDAIIQYAKEQNNSIIPFNDPSIINLFISVLNSTVSKNIIKRTSSGVPAIQAPTSELVTVIEDENRNIITNSEMYKNSIVIKDVLIEQKTLHSVKPGDVVQINNEIRLVSGYNSKIKKGYDHQYKVIGLEEIRKLDLTKNTLTKLNSKGRNLRGQNVEITLSNGNMVDLFDLGVSKLSYYLEDVKENNKRLIFSEDPDTNAELLLAHKNFLLSLSNINKGLDIKFNTLFKNYLAAKGELLSISSDKDVNIANEAIVKKYWSQVREMLNIVLQDELVKIKNGKFNLNGVYENIKETKVNSAECILGNAYATKFGLKSGDFLGDVVNQGSKFFKDKLNTAYSVENTNYDFALMSLSSPKIYVKVVDKLNDTYKDVFKKVTRDDGKRYVTDPSGKILAPFDENTMQIVQENNDIVIYTLPKGLQILDDTSTFGFIKPLNENFNSFLSVSKIVASGFNQDEYLNENNEFDLSKYNGSFNKFVDRQSIKLTTSFTQALEYIGVRIPAQSKQSSSNLKVVAFTPEDTNVVYIPSDIILYQGSDFDIDKLYMMGASINRQGIYDSWSPFFNYSSTEMLKLSHRLPIPTRITITASTVENGGLPIRVLSEKINIESLNDQLSDDKESLNLFITLLKEVNKYTANDVRIIAENEKELALVDLINKHNNYELSFDQKVNAIKNKIYGMSILIGNNVEDQISQTTQMSAETAKNIAQMSASEVEHFSNNNNVSKVRAQHRTQVGRGSIGPNANGTKAYSALLVYFQNKYKHLYSKGELDHLKLEIKGLNLKNDPLLNFTIPRIFNANLNATVNENMRNILRELKWEEEDIPVDGFKLLSVLITAATDNAKDPILQGINCTPALNGMYILLISLGVDMYKIGNFFTSPFMVELSKHVETDFGKNETFNNNLKNAIKYMFEGPKLSNYSKGSMTVDEDGQPLDYDSMDIEDLPSSTLNSQVGKNRYDVEKAYWETNIAGKFKDIIDNAVVKKNLITLVDATRELTTLVKLLSIDGGIKNDPQEYYEYVNEIESFVTDKLKSDNKEAKFNLNEFINDPRIAENNIKSYEKVKLSFNILDVIDNVPHIKGMLQAMTQTKSIIDARTIKGKLGTELLSELKHGVFQYEKLPPNTNSKVFKYIDQLIVNKFLKDKVRSFNIKNISDYYNYDMILEESVNQVSKELDFSNYGDVLTFKHWFEQDLIPALKEDEEFKNNKFISNLMMNSMLNTSKTERISVVTINTDLSLLKLEGSRDKYVEYLNGFYKVQNLNFPTMLDENTTIGDAFVLYNLIVNQNRVGKYSFNEILQSYFSNPDIDNKSGILGEFLNYESNLKVNDLIKGEDYNLDDLYIRFAVTSKDVKGFTKKWNAERNRFEIKKSDQNTKYISNDDSLEMPYLNKSVKVYKDNEYLSLYSAIAEAVKQGTLTIEFRCD